MPTCGLCLAGHEEVQHLLVLWWRTDAADGLLQQIAQQHVSRLRCAHRLHLQGAAAIIHLGTWHEAVTQADVAEDANTELYTGAMAGWGGGRGGGRCEAKDCTGYMILLPHEKDTCCQAAMMPSMPPTSSSSACT
jgi:hypothetical protein